jgi:hypothetical protein
MGGCNLLPEAALGWTGLSWGPGGLGLWFWLWLQLAVIVTETVGRLVMPGQGEGVPKGKRRQGMG